MMAAHAAGMPHTGMPYGQPMGAGHAQNAGQAMGQPLQMHPGASAPNGPHVTQAGPMMAAGMQAGAARPGPGAPNAHALSHLTPQGQMFAQQHNMQQAMSNPHLAMQHQQQQNFIRQQRLLQQQQQQQQNSMGMNMGMGFPNGPNPAMSAQHMAAMQGNPNLQAVNLPAHIQHQLQQQQMRQQQMAHHQQTQQQQALAQQMGMQHAVSQSANPAGHVLQGQQSQPGQPNQMRPQSQMSGGADGQGTPVPPGQHPQGQQPQAQAQSQPPAAQPQNQQQAVQQPQQQSQPQPQAQQPQQQAQQQQQQAHPQQQQQQNQHQQAAQQRQHHLAAQQQLALMRQQGEGRMRGSTMLKLMQFADHLSRFSSPPQGSELQGWQAFVNRFFNDDGFFRQTIWDSVNNRTKFFETPAASLPRYYYTLSSSGVVNMQMTFESGQEKELVNNNHYIVSDKARIIYWFANGTQLIWSGKLSVLYNANDKIDVLEFSTERHKEYIPRTVIESLFHQEPSSVKPSPRMNKGSAKQRNQQRQQQPAAEPSIVQSDLPEAPVREWGVTNAVMQYLEIGETLSNMAELLEFSHAHPELSPSDAMQRLVHTYQSGQHNGALMQQNPHPHLNLAANGLQQPLPPGARTPGMAMAAGGGNPNMARQPDQLGAYASPAIANLALPHNAAVNGSPHLAGGAAAGLTPSPAQAHMQAPGLVAQHSQQGTNSSVASGSNTTSPNVSNKRRRASAVKTEGDEGGGGTAPGEVNGVAGPPGATAKVKASPRSGAGGAKRVKGNAA